MFSFSKKFDCSVDEQVNRFLLGGRTMRESLEQMVIDQVNHAKALQIYENHCPAVDYPTGASPMRLKSGEDLSAEEQANEILVNSRRKEGKNADRREWLTVEQMMLRQHKEVYNQNGFPDSSLVSGMYRRVHNPLLGNRPGKQAKSEE